MRTRRATSPLLLATATALVVSSGCPTPGAAPPLPDAATDLAELPDDGDTNVPPDAEDARRCEHREVLANPVLPDDGFPPEAPFSGQARDFSLMAFRGPLTLADLGGGCEPIVIFIHVPGMNDGLFASSASQLADSSDWDTNYLFVSDAPDDAERERVVTAAAESVDRALRSRIADAALRERRALRFHFGLTRASAVEGSLGAHVRAWHAAADDPERGVVDLGERGVIGLPPPSVVGIDPALEWDPGGSLAPWVGARPELGMGRWLGDWLGWRAATERVDPPGLLRVALHDATTTARTLVLDVPALDVRPRDAVDLELEVLVRCEEVHPLACSEWDRIARVSACLDASPGCEQRVEIARWITPYWRRGRQLYRLPVRHAAPLLLGADRRVHVELGPEWERPTPWHIEIALRAAPGDAPLPAAVDPVLTGGPFDERFGEEAAFRTRPGMSRAELWVVVSGHGQTDGDNCAEWCDHRHHVELNGSAVLSIRHDAAPIGDASGCAERAGAGVMPLQWGNWAPQRAYWCPGEQVAWRAVPLDDVLAPPGADNRLVLLGTLGDDGAPPGGDIALTALVVWYE